MMLLYPGAKRYKQSSKDGGTKASGASITSMNTSKGSRSSTENPKKGSSQGKAKGKMANTGNMQKTSASKDSKSKSKESEKRAPNVFEYLDSDSDEFSEDDITIDVPRVSKYSSKAPHIGARLPTQGATNHGHMKPRRSMESYHTDKQNLDLTSIPESYYPSQDASSLHNPHFPPSPPQSPEDNLHNVDTRQKPTPQPVPSGYGSLARQLSSSVDKDEPSLSPLYRRFEDINHRVLLYLQDEIAQMEEELRVLDEYDEMHRVATAEQEGTSILPASRRMDAQAHMYSSLHYRREEVMATLIHKTQQYNTSLSAYSKVMQGLPGASEKDVDTYRAWIKKHNPIAAPETNFLDYTKDLVTFPRRPTARSGSVFSTIIIASAAILFPLIAFSMIAEFSGRLLVVAMAGGAASAIASNMSTGTDQLVASHDGWRIAALYFGFMTFVAMFIP